MSRETLHPARCPSTGLRGTAGAHCSRGSGSFRNGPAPELRSGGQVAEGAGLLSPSGKPSPWVRIPPAPLARR